MNELVQANARDLERELQWFRRVVDTRLKLYFGQESEESDIMEITPPDLVDSSSNWARLLHQYDFGIPERLMLLLALIPCINARTLDVFFIKNRTYDRPFTEFGGLYQESYQVFLPTVETLLFLLSANRLEQRFAFMKLFQPDHFLIRDHIVTLNKRNASDLLLTAELRISDEYLANLTYGEAYQPAFGIDFPAKEIQTELDWSDLVLAAETRRQLQEMEAWIKHGDTLLHDWGMSGKIRPGFRALFYGSSGTGKTVTACILGKTSGRKVYRVDLSMVVSKYIGETEKNLAKVFQQAENRNWILFFDEADALFGKRSDSNSAHERYANQEVSYLLQRMESFEGIVILALNLKENLDHTFAKEFEAIIHFPMPGSEERLRIWQLGISKKARLASNVDLEEVAGRFELSGGAIMNVIRYASLEALRKGSTEISLNNLRTGIRREFAKTRKLI